MLAGSTTKGLDRPTGAVTESDEIFERIERELISTPDSQDEVTSAPSPDFFLDDLSRCSFFAVYPASLRMVSI